MVDWFFEKLYWNIVWNIMYILYMCLFKVIILLMEKFGWGDLFISKYICCKCFNNVEKWFCVSVSVIFLFFYICDILMLVYLKYSFMRYMCDFCMIKF